MRLHLTIQRHGLPVARILWTTSPPSLLGPNASPMLSATSSAVTSSRMPNALYSNGGYTIAQLLEDVNEVIPLETEPRLFEDESSGQWGLEDYVVEVGGSECLHFMELDGILRDGDEVLIRALQMSDLKARRISGRHQISNDGKHLIDGVPFGKPFLKRPTSSRPAITIPPRKKRRTALALWGSRSAYEEEDTEWAPPQHIGTGKELSLLKPESVFAQGGEDEYEDAYQDDYEDFHEPHEDGDGTVIRHHIDKQSEVSESENDDYNADPGELSQELQDLKKDLVISELPSSRKPNARAPSRGYSLRSRSSILHPAAPRKSSLSRKSTEAPPEREPSRRKSVTFNKQKQSLSTVEPEPSVSIAGSTSEEAEHSVSSENDSDSSVSDSSASESSDGDSASGESDSETKIASESGSASSSDDDSSSDSSISESESESEREEAPTKDVRKPIHEANPPGAGSERTRKSNQRTKMRRRLTKLKQLGLLEENADFDALREYDSRTGVTYFTDRRANTKKQEQEDFEAKRQQLLRSLESGGVDVSLLSEKENMSPSPVEAEVSQLPEDFDETQYETANEKTEETTPDLPKRRSLDVASTRRLLFGSLGVRTPRSKEEEEATRKKLAGKVLGTIATKPEEVPAEAHESEPEVDWREKLVLQATECVYDDIELNAPPFPFHQHWDPEAGEEIRRRNGRNRKRKRRQQLQLQDEEAYGNQDYYVDEEIQLDYNDAMEVEAETDHQEGSNGRTKMAVEAEDDVPGLPENATTLPDLAENDLKPGLVFAFKQLDVSKATNWQPAVSEYRVAVVSGIFDDKILSIQLTKPYRKEPKDKDAEEGSFQYSGFEMPGLDDDEEIDDGFREVPFDDLIEPKLLRAAHATDASEAGDKGNASNSPADDEQPAQKPGQAIEVSVSSNEQEDDQLAEISSLPPTSPHDGQSISSVPVLHEDSPVRSPRFEGFDQSISALGHLHADSSAKSNSTSHGEQAEASLEEDDEAPRSTYSPNADSHDLQDTGLTDNLQTISSPGSVGSYNKPMSFLISQNPSSPESERKSSPRERTSASDSPTVPNPFYAIDKAYGERRQRSRTKTQRDPSYDNSSSKSARKAAKVEVYSSPPRYSEKPKSPSPEWEQGQETSMVSMIPDSVMPELRDPSPPASQMRFVDLTQPSPPVSPGGSDEDYAKSKRLPRGPGWVQKNNPTRRQTRLSSSQAERKGIRTFEEVSISPPRRRQRKSRP